MSVNKVGELTQAEAARIMRDKNATIAERALVIEQFGERLASEWQATDHNDYNINLDDDAIARAKASGKQSTEENVGYKDGPSSGAYGDLALGAAAVGSVAASSVVGNALATKAGAKAGERVVSKGIGTYIEKDITKRLAKKSVEKGSQEVTKKTAQAAGAISTVVITTAVLAKYLITKPNQEQDDAVRKLRDEEYPTAQSKAYQTEDDITRTANEIQEGEEEVEAVNEEAGEIIEQDKTQLEIHKARFDQLKAKKGTKAGLTEDEKTEYKTLAGTTMKQYSEHIGATADEASGTVGDIHSEVEGKIDDLQTAGEDIASIDGVNQYAAGIDENLKTQSTVEAVAMGANGASAGWASVKLLTMGGFTFGLTTAMGVLGAATAVKSTTGFGIGGDKGAMAEQLEFRNDAKEEIKLREDTESLVEGLNSHLDDELDNYAGALDNISEKTTLDMPKDVSYNAEDSASTSITAIAAENDNNKKNNKKSEKNQPQNPPQYALNFKASNNTNQTRGAQNNNQDNKSDNKNEDDKNKKV